MGNSMGLIYKMNVYCWGAGEVERRENQNRGLLASLGNLLLHLLPETYEETSFNVSWAVLHFNNNNNNNNNN